MSILIGVQDCRHREIEARQKKPSGDSIRHLSNLREIRG